MELKSSLLSFNWFLCFSSSIACFAEANSWALSLASFFSCWAFVNCVLRRRYSTVESYCKGEIEDEDEDKERGDVGDLRGGDDTECRAAEGVLLDLSFSERLHASPKPRLSSTHILNAPVAADHANQQSVSKLELFVPVLVCATLEHIHRGRCWRSLRVVLGPITDHFVLVFCMRFCYRRLVHG